MKDFPSHFGPPPSTVRVSDATEPGSMPQYLSDLCGTLSKSPSQKGKSSNIKLTQKEGSDFIFASSLLESCTENNLAVAHIASALDLSTDDVVKNVLRPIVKVKSKLGRSIKSPKTSRQGKSTYFTGQVKASPHVSALYAHVEDSLGDRKLFYDQVESTCPIDVRNMLTVYVDTRRLRTPSGIVLDEFLNRYVSNPSNVTAEGRAVLNGTGGKEFWQIIKAMMSGE